MKNYFFLISCVSVFLVACSSGGSDDSESPVPAPVQKNTPALFSLHQPANNQPCTTGSTLASDDTRLNVSFQWGSSAFASEYLLTIQSNGTQVYSQSTQNTSLQVVLEKGKTYSWQVRAKNDNGEKTSDTFSFITEGLAVTNYAPYAAATTVVVHADDTLGISWTGSDPDHSTNELSYQLKVYENDVLILETASITENSYTSSFMVLPETLYKIGLTSIDPENSYTTSYTYIVTD